MSRKGLLGLAAIFALAIGIAFLISGWRYANPSYSWTTFDGRTYSAEAPSHWKVEVVRAKQDEGTTFIESRPFGPGDSVSGHALTIEDFGTKNSTLEGLVADIRKQEGSPSPMKRVRLANGLDAFTWTASQTLAVEVGAYYRAYAFLGPNKRLYSTMHYLFSWKEDWRSDNMTRRILGSMKFKDAPPAKK